MSIVPKGWTETTLDVIQFHRSTPLAKVFGWTFWEHPTLGDEHTILATSMDYMGNHGPIVYDTHDYDIPDYL